MVHETDGIHVFWHSDVLLLLSGHKKPDLVLVRVLLSNYGTLYSIQCCLDIDLRSVHKFFAVRPDMGIDLDSLSTLMMRGSVLMVRESACMRGSQSI